MFDHIPSVSGIYAIVNKQNGHRYVGQANNMNERVREHVRKLDQVKNTDGLLQKAWNEYGSGAFEFVVLEKVSNNWKKDDRDHGRRDNLSLAEHFYVNERSEYNKDKRIVAKKYKTLVDAKAWRKPQS